MARYQSEHTKGDECKPFPIQTNQVFAPSGNHFGYCKICEVEMEYSLRVIRRHLAKEHPELLAGYADRMINSEYQQHPHFSTVLICGMCMDDSRNAHEPCNCTGRCEKNYMLRPVLVKHKWGAMNRFQETVDLATCWGGSVGHCRVAHFGHSAQVVDFIYGKLMGPKHEAVAETEVMEDDEDLLDQVPTTQF